MSYTDFENRSKWGALDRKALNSIANDYDIDPNEAIEHIEELDLDMNDINSHFYGVLYIAGSKYLDALRNYCEENEIDIEDTRLNDSNEEILKIYTNYLDSGFDTDISDYITLNPTEEEIISVLEFLEIKEKDNELESKDLEDIKGE